MARRLGGRLLVATRNRGKWRELRELLRGLPVEVLSLEHVPEAPEVAETGDTFEANARLKARGAADALGLPALADDSGLVVPALGGRPGVFSARYAGLQASDEDNRRKLLAELDGRPAAERAAFFCCALVLAWPGGRDEIVCHGSCEGLILSEPRGGNGFGYDPLFYYAPLGKTFAELSPAEKSAVSHRGRALRELRRRLEDEA